MDDFSPMPPRRGRAAADNPPNRFEPLHVVEDPAALDEDERRQIPTELLRDTTRNILSRNDSPDIPFTYSLNPYRGCEHGCSYCYARPTHEYLGFSGGLDFETKIVVKEEAPQLLDQVLQKPSWTPQTIVMSGGTDPYQPVERQLRITRGCLKVFLRHRHPVSLITKNQLVTRDLDLLAKLAAYDLVHVMVSITSLKNDVVGLMEPRTSRPAARLQAVEELAAAGVPVGVHAAPLIPGLTDEELPAILEAAATRGATTAGYIVVRLPGVVKPLFIDWLRRSFPDRADRVLRRLRELRGEALNDNRFGKRMRAEGEWADLLHQLYRVTCRRLGLNEQRHRLATEHYRRLPGGQMDLF